VTRRHARGLAQVHRRRHHHHGYQNGRRPSYRRGTRSTSQLRGTLHRRPTQTRAIGARGHVGRPRPGFVRVVTPVRVPGRSGHPARTVRVVSDVKVPRGAVPAGRPATVAGRRHR
jgi:hypothetical protein